MTLTASFIAELIQTALGLMGAGDARIPPPRIEYLEPAVLQQRVCGKPCNAQAWFSPEGVIFLDERIDPSRFVVAKGILLHELVHHLQFSIKGGKAANCEEWVRREREAYRVQGQWLWNQGIDATPLMWQARTVNCHPLMPGRQQSSEAPPATD